jgi:hypothetical protein
MQRPARLEQLRAGGLMNGAVDSAAAEQRTVGGVHDRVDGEPCDVSPQCFEHRRVH